MAGFFRRLLGIGRQLQCPFCLGECSLGRWDRDCNAPGGCGRRLPPWIRRDDVSYAPLGVQLLGWPGAGKTAYTAALYPSLANLITVWPDYYLGTADADTGEFVRRVRGELGGHFNGPPADGACYIAHGLPRRWLPGGARGRAVVLREFFDRLPRPDEPDTSRLFFRNARAFVLCVPWTPVGHYDTDRHGEREAQLVGELVRELLRERAVPVGARIYGAREPATLIVNFTQADHADAQGLLPDPLALYLRNDPLSFGTAAPGALPVWSEEPLDDYLAEMNHVSELIALFTQARMPLFSVALQGSERSGFRVRFCVTSSVGIPDAGPRRPDAPPRGAGVFVRVRPGEPLPPPVRPDSRRSTPRPLRVLDPILTALELER